MKKLLALAAVALATSAFAQSELTPSGGNYYPDDAMNQGYITASFADSIAVPSATITFAGVSHDATVEPIGFNGTTYRVNVAEVLNGQAANTQFSLAVGNLTGNYVWQPVFPLTSITPESGTVLTSKTQTVVFNFNTPVSYSAVRLTSGSVMTRLAQNGTNVTSISVDLVDSQWGSPVGGVNNMTIALMGVNADGVAISNASGSEGVIVANYTIEEASAGVEYLGVEPSEDWAYAEELWDYWNVVFMFSDEVTLTDPENTAVIRFYDDLGDELIDVDPIYVPTDEVYSDWNYRGGFYGVEIPAPEIVNMPADFAYLTISLQGIAYNKVLLENQPVAKYETMPSSFNVRKSPNNTARVLGITASEHENNIVYSITGNKVEINDIQDLPAGIYIRH